MSMNVQAKAQQLRGKAMEMRTQIRTKIQSSSLGKWLPAQPILGEGLLGQQGIFGQNLNLQSLGQGQIRDKIQARINSMRTGGGVLEGLRKGVKTQEEIGIIDGNVRVPRATDMVRITTT